MGQQLADGDFRHTLVAVLAQPGKIVYGIVVDPEFAFFLQLQDGRGGEGFGMRSDPEDMIRCQGGLMFQVGIAVGAAEDDLAFVRDGYGETGQVVTFIPERQPALQVRLYLLQYFLVHHFIIAEGPVPSAHQLPMLGEVAVAPKSQRCAGSLAAKTGGHMLKRLVFTVRPAGPGEMLGDLLVSFPVLGFQRFNTFLVYAGGVQGARGHEAEDVMAEGYGHFPHDIARPACTVINQGPFAETGCHQEFSGAYVYQGSYLGLFIRKFKNNHSGEIMHQNRLNASMSGYRVRLISSG